MVKDGDFLVDNADIKNGDKSNKNQEKKLYALQNNKDEIGGPVEEPVRPNCGGDWTLGGKAVDF